MSGTAAQNNGAMDDDALPTRSIERLEEKLQLRDWAKWDAEHRVGFAKSLRVSAAHLIESGMSRRPPNMVDIHNKKMSGADIVSHGRGLEKAAGMVERGHSAAEIHAAADKAGGRIGDAMHGAAAEMENQVAMERPR